MIPLLFIEMRRLIAFVLVAASVCVAADLSLMPLPFQMAAGEGKLVIDGHFGVRLSQNASPRLKRATSRFMSHVSQQTGIPFLAQDTERLVISSSGPGAEVSKLGEDESYTLNVTTSIATLTARTDLGALRGLATLEQLVQETASGFSIPAIHIEDHPRFAWRGLLIDVTSHWMPVEVIERNLDAMAAVKLNVFHWHLTDDQGFRVESIRFPKLQQLGSDGDYYTQKQIREVIAYAHDRGIRILPEFDMPGHCSSWLAGYPELASVPGAYSIIHTFGVYDPVLDPTKDEVYDFIDALLTEMTALFPDEYFHIGGDEVNGKQWHASAHIQEFIRAHQLKDEHGLQTYFNTKLESLVRKHGKKMIGWDEILHPDLPSDIMIHSWRDQESLRAAVIAGHPAILSFGYYLDHLDHAGYHYSIDPQAGTDAGKERILGGESAMWTEYVSPETIDSRIWPKTAAIAERLWSKAEVRDTSDMYRRLEVVSRELSWYGVTHLSNYDSMLSRLAGYEPTTNLRVLADAVEPLGIDGRETAGHYSQSTPLNRLVDTARSESITARRLEDEIQRAQDWEKVRITLLLWKNNDAALAPLLTRHFLLTEAISLSQNLSKVGEIGLQALDYVQKKRRAPSQWVSAALDALNDMEKPHAEVVLAAVRPVRILVQAAAR